MMRDEKTEAELGQIADQVVTWRCGDAQEMDGVEEVIASLEALVAVEDDKVEKTKKIPAVKKKVVEAAERFAAPALDSVSHRVSAFSRGWTILSSVARRGASAGGRRSGGAAPSGTHAA
eukprot:1952477-Rhodomonas_salina.6